jgi:predicted Zn-dependent protease
MQHPRDSLSWNALARLYLQDKQSLRSFEALAEREASKFDYDSAIAHLLAARDAENNIPDSTQKHLQSSINDSKRIKFELLRDKQRSFEKSIR